MCMMDPKNAVGESENSKDGVMPAFCSAIPTRRGRFSQ